MTTVRVEFYTHAGRQFTGVWNYRWQHEGIIQGMEDEGRDVDMLQIRPATGLRIIIVDVGKAMQGRSNSVIEAQEIP